MTSIIENLYLGDTYDAHEVQTRLNQITHILSVESKPLPIKILNGIKYMYVHCLDMDNYDLLSHIPECIKFIDEGRNNGSVLVHCCAGQSRSGAVVVAYLMHHLQMELTDALAYARKMRPMVSPNDGFMDQLKLFEKMGNTVDFSFQAFKHFQVKLLSEQYRHMQSTNEVVDIPDNLLAGLPSPSDSKVTTYKCKKCRSTLFGQQSLVPHAPRTGKGRTCSQSYFVDPLMWMKESILKISGKLSCPGCNCKIGSFSWCGEKCGCTQWVTPSFQLLCARIDMVPFNQNLRGKVS